MLARAPAVLLRVKVYGPVFQILKYQGLHRIRNNGVLGLRHSTAPYQKDSQLERFYH